MIKNYLIIAWRNFLRDKSTSVISIAGLSSGLAVALLIGLWIIDEVSFNKSFKNYEHIAQVYHHVTFGDQKMTISDVPAPLGEKLRTSFIEFDKVATCSYAREHVLSFEDKNLSRPGRFVEPQFIDIFSLNIVDGAKTLEEKNSIMLSQRLAAALLGNHPVGKVVKFDDRDLLTVVGVFEDFPPNSEFKDLDMLVPLAYYFGRDDGFAKQEHNWENYSFECFVTLRDAKLIDHAEAKMKNTLFDNASGDGKTLKPVGMLFPMKKWHLYADFNDGLASGRQIRFVWMFGIIAVFVLLLACINFINLCTARAEKRSKEVGVRKVMGSARRQLVWQFLTESVMLTFISFLLAVMLSALILPWFNELAGKEMSFDLARTDLLIISFALVIVTSILAGSYPAMYLASFSPVKVLKGTFKAGRYASVPRKVLVIFQFTTSIILITGTVVVFQQIQHAKDRPAGFDREGIIHVPVRTEGLAGTDYNSLRQELLATGVVEDMAISDFPVTGTMSADASLTWEGKDPSSHPLVAMNSCSHDFPKTNGFQFVEGRDFSRDHASDSMGVIVNELAAQVMGGKDILGKKITIGYGKPREVIGVIKDQVRWTPFVKQSPHIYYINYKATGSLTVRFAQAASTRDALQKVEAAIKKFDASAPFNYEFLDDDYAGMFRQEERIGTLATVFASLAILISCIGLFGLASFATIQRAREISIRKVLGASVFGLWKMLLKDFLLLVVAAIVVGIPIAWFLSSKWLQQYEYRTDLSWVIFLLTGVIAMSITIVTVSFETLRAALANPVRALKRED
jgi:predicted permease